MFLYRLSKRIYAGDKEGLGSKLYGGRWNKIGIPCIYTSESRALAILEYAANIELTMIPRTLAITIYEVPAQEFYNCQINDLPIGWDTNPGPVSAKEFGSKLLAINDYLGIKVPSAIIPQEYNYLINPQSLKTPEISVIDVEDFIFDKRIKM